MAALYLASISEKEFPEFVRELPGLVSPHAAYLEQLWRREGSWVSNAGNKVVRVPVSL
jgi:hypothetical protein